MNKPYNPQADSLPSQVIGYFTNNPDEELQLEDISDKFGCSRGNIHTQLARAVESGMLVRDQNKDGEYIYKAGGNTPKAKPAPAKPVRSGVDTDAVCRSRKRVDLPLPDPAKVLIEDNIPLLTRCGPGSRIDWMPLFKRVQVGQSFKLPLAAKATVTKTMTECHKAQLGKFTIRTFKDTLELRVWRTA